MAQGVGLRFGFRNYELISVSRSIAYRQENTSPMINEFTFALIKYLIVKIEQNQRILIYK